MSAKPVDRDPQRKYWWLGTIVVPFLVALISNPSWWWDIVERRHHVVDPKEISQLNAEIAGRLREAKMKANSNSYTRFSRSGFISYLIGPPTDTDVRDKKYKDENLESLLVALENDVSAPRRDNIKRAQDVLDGLKNSYLSDSAPVDATFLKEVSTNLDKVTHLASLSP